MGNFEIITNNNDENNYEHNLTNLFDATLVITVC